MKKYTIRFLNVILCAVLLMSMALPAMAADVSVTYDGQTQKFVVSPGSEESATNLFPDFAGVMPGDSLNATVTVKNDASNMVKVKIYLRALGAVENADFLNQLELTVKQEGNSVLFDGTAGETAGLTEWKCLGTFYSGAEVDLNVTIEVPIEMGDEFQNAKGSFQWEFKVEEYPIETTDPEVPKTGDQSNLVPMLVIMGVSIAAIIFLLIVLIRKRKKEET